MISPSRQLMSRSSSFLTATPARRRMVNLAVVAVLLNLFITSTDILMPLWATKRLGLSAGDWAQLRSLRMAGILVGVIVLGALSDRFGQRVLGAISMLGAGLFMVLMTLDRQYALWLGMPVFGALVSTVYVNLNTLTQGVSARRQGLANSLYRSVSAATAIAAPVLCTALVTYWGGYPPVFYALAVLLVIGAVVLWRYPGEERAQPIGDLFAELGQMWQGYLAAWRARELMRVIHLSQLWGSMLAGVGVFAAIRFTQQLPMSIQGFGMLATIGGLFGFLLTAFSAFYLDRVSLRLLHGYVGVLAALGAVLMGVGNTLPLSIAGFLLAGALPSTLYGPISMWISRAGTGCSQTAAFTMHKLFTAIYGAVTMALLAFLEAKIGIRLTLLGGGILGVIVALGFLLLPEPGRKLKVKRQK